MKKLTLDEIKAGVLVKGLEKVTVQLKVEGEDAEFDTFVKPFSYATAVAQLKAYGEDKEALAGVLASCLCDETGGLIFTEDDVRKHFSQSLVDAIWEKVYDVNFLGKTSKSQQKTNSSVKSQSQQEVPSQKSASSTSKKSKHGQPTETSEAV